MIVKVYAAVLVITMLLFGVIWHGKSSNQQVHDFRETFFGALVWLPILGRVFGWW